MLTSENRPVPNSRFTDSSMSADEKDLPGLMVEVAANRLGIDALIAAALRCEETTAAWATETDANCNDNRTRHDQRRGQSHRRSGAQKLGCCLHRAIIPFSRSPHGEKTGRRGTFPVPY